VNEELERYYELLGLAPGATPEQLKAAHRDLVKVWHPDRFAHDPRLQQKAQEKLKEINEAFEALTSGRAPRRPQTAPRERQRVEAPPPARARSRWPSLFLAALVCGAVFAAAFYTLRARGVTPARATEKAPAASVESPRNEAAGQQTQVRKRPEREATEAPAEAVDGGAPAAERPLPTVTVLIDPTTGLLATPACPVRSRTTYATGNEPRRQCDAHRKEASDRAP
jgi:hypothetical protein